MANIPAFLKKNGESLEFALEDSEFVFFVPEAFFDNDKIASIRGEECDLLGICNYTIFDKNGKNNGLHPFTFPTLFTTAPYLIEKRKGLQLKTILKESYDSEMDDYGIETFDTNADPDTSDLEEESADYRILRYKKGDKIIVNTHVPKSIDNVEIFFRLFLITAKFPTTIPYDRLHEYWIKNAELNGFSYNLNMQMFGLIVSEVARSKNDITKPFRLSKSTDMNGYKPISLKLTPKFVSPFVSITSENFDQSLMGAITTENKNSSPLEKILMM